MTEEDESDDRENALNRERDYSQWAREREVERQREGERDRVRWGGGSREGESDKERWGIESITKGSGQKRREGRGKERKQTQQKLRETELRQSYLFTII